MDIELPDYSDNGNLREQDNVPLLDFLSRHDRAQLSGRGEPFFSGREAEINAFRSAATGLLLDKPGNATMVFEGPPGAGKSALLAQFQEEMRAFPPVGGNRRRWLPVFMNGAQARSPAEIMRKVDLAIKASDAPPHERALRSSWRGAKRFLNAIARGDQHRNTYYGERLGRLTHGGNEEFRGYAQALAPALRECPEGLMYQDILAILSKAEPKPPRERTAEFLSAAIHCGFLAKDDSTGLHSMPIPSFARHVLSERLPPVPYEPPPPMRHSPDVRDPQEHRP